MTRLDAYRALLAQPDEDCLVGKRQSQPRYDTPDTAKLTLWARKLRAIDVSALLRKDA